MTNFSLAEQVCRPQRIGLFGHRGVGKTTLLTMWYREAVGGRLSELRLAAGDAPTANYLAAKILHLENGEALPATLAETELRVQLYHQSQRLELLVKDYQGEHVRIGSTQPIRDFLRDCDAVLLCLDPAILDDPRERLEAQQEVEQVIEDYLALEKGNAHPRPMALVLTKSDRLPPTPEGTDEATHLRQLVETHLGMTLHALRQHAPQQPLFAVSALGGAPSKTLRPQSLAEPLCWLAGALQAQDKERLAQLAESNAPLLVVQRAIDVLSKRYPGAKFVEQQRRRCQERRRQRTMRRVVAGIAAVVVCGLGLFGYEALGAYRMRQLDEREADPAIKAEEWKAYQSSHPARHVLGFGSAREEEEHLKALEQQQRRERARVRFAELKQRAANPDANPEEVWKEYEAFQNEYKDLPFDEETAQLRAVLKPRYDARLEQRAELALSELRQAQELAPEERDLILRRNRLSALVKKADEFLRTFPGTPQEKEARQRRDWARERIDDLDFEVARLYSTENPLNFQTRREQYLTYLDLHANGRHAEEAKSALDTIDRDWERHDWKPVADQWRQACSNVKELTARSQHYIRVHPQGKYRERAEEMLRWCGQVTEEREYRVILKSGKFDKSLTRVLRSAPDLSVELEVGGVRYGPSQVVADSLTPEWNYEFPRPIRWKMGDQVRIFVYNHDYYKKLMFEINSGDDPLGMNFLSVPVESGPHSVLFESDYWMPRVPSPK